MMLTVWRKMLMMAGMPAEKAYGWLNGSLQNPEQAGVWVCLTASFIFVIASPICASLCEDAGILFGPSGPIAYHRRPKSGVVLLRVAIFAVLSLIHFATYRVAVGYMVAAAADFSVMSFWALVFVPATIIGVVVFLFFYAY